MRDTEPGHSGDDVSVDGQDHLTIYVDPGYLQSILFRRLYDENFD